MAVINTNYLALVAQNNLNASQSQLGTAIERLSSGLRINSAKDDAAGMAISTRFSTSIDGLNQASRNSNDGISIAQTTESALSQVTDNLSRIRQLSVQAANGSNSDKDLSSIQQEIDMRLEEINRVSDQTQFNGVKVLGDSSSLTIQVGSNDGETISIDLQQMNAETLGLTNLDMSNQMTSDRLTAVGTNGDSVRLTEELSLKTLKVGNPSAIASALPNISAIQIADDGTLFVGSTTASTQNVVTYNADTGTFSFDSTENPASSLTAASGSPRTFVDGNGQVVDLDDTDGLMITDTADSAQEFRVGSDGNVYLKVGSEYFSGTLTMSTGAFSAGSAISAASVLAIASAGEVATSNQDVASFGSTGTIAISGDQAGGTLMKADNGDFYVKDGNQYFQATVNASGAVTTGNETIVDPLAALDSALDQVSELRSAMGAVQNRFEATIDNLNSTSTNLQAARSRIQDADYATEVSALTRAQILQQAGTSVLAQANQVPQTMLSLLR